MPETYTTILPEDDYNDFALLTAQESHTIEGQIAKIDMVKAMVNRRQDAHVKAVSEELIAAGFRDQELKAQLAARVQKIKVHTLDLSENIERPTPDGKGVIKISRSNLVVEKGEGDDHDPHILRVMIPAHVDTVKSDAPTELQPKLDDIDRFEGLGVYDMGAGVLNNIALATSVRVPDGMKVYFVFTVDEEENSVGARKLMENQLTAWPKMDVVLSSEIGPVNPVPTDSNRMRIIAARAGRVKFNGEISIDPGSQGHGAEADLANASEAMHDVLQRMKSRLYEGFEREPPFQEDHHLLGKERFEHGETHAWRTLSGYRNPDQAKFDFAVRTNPVSRTAKLQEVMGPGAVIPDDPLAQMQMFFEKVMTGIKKRGEWDRFGLSGSFFRNPSRASYAPYEMPADHPLLRIACETVERISGVAPEIVAAPSVSDENDYAFDMLRRARVRALERGEKPTSLTSFEGTTRGVLTFPPNGDNAHNREEWVSKRSILMTREVIRSLIEDATGLASLLPEKKQRGDNF